MTKQQITIEVDVPEGFDAVLLNCCIGNKQTDGAMHLVYLEYKPTWQWPAWLKAEWVAMDDCGDWYGYDVEPSRDDESWTNNGEWVRLTDNMLDFTPPHCTDWRQSKRRRPT